MLGLRFLSAVLKKAVLDCRKISHLCSFKLLSLRKKIAFICFNSINLVSLLKEKNGEKIKKKTLLKLTYICTHKERLN